MNDFIRKFLQLQGNDSIILEKNKVYDVYDDDCIELDGYYCSNTASKAENPTGKRYTAIWLENKNNIVIDGNGSTVMIHGIMTPIILRNCKNIIIKNLTIDYARPTMSEFAIKENRNGECILDIHPESHFEIRDNTLIWLGEKKSDGTYRWQNSYKNNTTLSMFYNPTTNHMNFLEREDEDKFPSVPTFSKIEQSDENTLKVTLKNKNSLFPKGCVVQTRSVIRDQIGGFFERCKNLVFDNLRIMFIHGLGMLSQYCENITFKNCDLTPKDNRTFASNADFFQFSGCKGHIVIKNNRAFGSHDDFINVHGTHLRIIEQCKEDNSIIVRFENESSWGFQAFKANDTIEFIKWDTLVPYYKTRVRKYIKINDREIKLHLQKPLPHIELQKDVVSNITWMPSLTVKNNYFGYSAARGILCTTPKKVRIEKNVFEKNAGPALLIEDDCNFWFESGYSKNVIFKNNKIIDCGYMDEGNKNLNIAVTPKVINTDSNPMVHYRLKVINNHFTTLHGTKHLFQLYHIKYVKIKNNRFDTIYEIEQICKKIIQRDNIY